MEDMPLSFGCSDCQRHFPNLPELSRHRELLHSSANQDSEEADSIPHSYRSQQCERGYHHPGNLVNHQRNHETSPFPCTNCGKDFTNPLAFQNHMRTHASKGHQRHRPPYAKDTTPHRQSEAVATDSWGQRFGSGEGWEDETKHVRETHECEPGADSRAAPPTKQREGPEIQPDPKGSTEDWVPTSNSGGVLPLHTPASNLLSNLEQYLAESVVNFTGAQESTEPLPAEEERRYKCDQCGKTYKHAGSLTNHRQSHTVGIYPCAICFKEFSNLMALKNHSRLHAQYRPYHCPHCPRAFRLPRDLLEHQQSHEGVKQEQPWEEKEMPTTNGHADERRWDQLPKTEMLNGSGELNTSGQQEDGGPEEYRPFCCGDCGRTYRHAGSLINHRKSHQTGIYPCSICSKQLFNAAALKNHIRAHHRPRQGGVEDGQSSVSSAALKLAETTPKEEEVPTANQDHRPYKCNECGRAYRHRGSLVNHRHSHRTGEYQCSLCPRKYPNLMALRNHVRVHCKAARRRTDPVTEGSPVEKEQPDPVGAEGALYTDQEQVCTREEEATSFPPAADGTVPQTCSVCGMLFEDLKSLGHHALTHRAGEGEKSRTDSTVSPPRTFACRDCGKSYRHSGSLINHRRTHQTGDFSCGTCAKHFHTMAAMKSHLRRHSRQWNRSRQKQDSTGEKEEEEAKLPPWTLKLENDEDLDPSQDPLGESPCGTEDSLEGDEDCLQAGSTGNECGLKREEACFLGDKEGTGTEEGLEKKEACFLDNLNITGDEESSETGFCDSLPGVDSDQKPSVCQSASSPRPTHSDSVWKAEVAHTCSDCGDSFPNAASLLSHRSCHPPGIYQCSLCPKEFDSLPALRSHFQNHRPGEVASAQPFLCCLCGMIFPGRTGYRRHLRQAHGTSGITEGSEEEEGEEEGTAEAASTHSPPLQLSEAELLNQLQREVEALDGAGYGHICGCCGQTYDDLGSLERHHQSQISSSRTENVPSHSEGLGNAIEMVEDHVLEGAVTSVSEEGGDTKSEEGVDGTVAHSLCMQAGESFLESHPRPFQCNQCGKTYRHGGSLVNHRKIHQTGDFICPVCSRCYPNLAAYRNHLRNHPRCKGSEPQVGPSSEAGCHEPQNAAEAEQEQAVIGQLQEELKVEPLEELARVKEEVWEETTVKEEELEQRLQTKGCQTEVSSERPFSCEVCGRTYKHAGSLINHRQSHQTGHFGCQACSKDFSNLMSLKNHRRIHADPRHFCCSECGKAFRLRKQLSNHQRVHTEPRRGRDTQKLIHEDRPFRCGQCGRTYRHAGSLLKHQCNHETGHYSCPFCFKTYSNRTALKDHQRQHSASQRRRAGWPQRAAAIRCTLCGCGFPGQESLEQHMQEHETKRELASGQGGQHGTEGSKENLDDEWGLESRSDGIQSMLQPEQEAKSPMRPAGSGVTKSLSWEVRKVDGCQGDRGQMNHNGAWVFQDQLTKPEGKLEDTISRNPCHHSESHSNDPAVSYMDSWDSGDSSFQLQPESHSNCCSQCGKTYCQPDGLSNPNINRKDGHNCLLCSKEFLNPVNTKIHNHIADQTLACSNCSKAFESHSELATHMQTHVEHSRVPSQTEETRDPQAGVVEVDLSGPGKAQEASSEPPGDAEENGEADDGGQGINFTAAEDKERPFCCAQCGRSYRHAGSLLNHQKAHTTGLYPCSLCPKLLPNLLSLKNHSRTHTDPKRYSCNICGKAFRTAARLQGHGRVHAPQEGPFTCSHCPRHFRHRISFLRHQQQHQEEWTVSSSGASVAPATSRGDSCTASILDPSSRWPADLSYSL